MKKITLLLALFLVLISWNINAQITTYPYFEDFESGDGGWTVDDPVPGLWELGTPANTIINSADTGANAWVTNLTGDYAAGEDTSVVSPVFDLSSLSAPSIEFSLWWDAEFSWDGMVLQSSIDAGTSWQNVGDLGDPNNWFNDGSIGGNPGGQAIGWTGTGANGSGGWLIARHALIGLAGESNVLLRFAFASDGSGQNEGVGFDSINVFEVSCPEPSGITLAGITGTTADVTWTAGGAETAWEIVVQAAGAGAPTGSGTSTASNNPYTETGLIPVTDYEVYVRSDCSGEFSSWVGPIAFQTACTTFVPDYNADMSVNVPDCWDESDDGEIADGPSGSGTSGWDDGNTYALGASNAINLYQGDVAREWLLSPAFDLSADGYQLEINVAVTDWNNGFADDAMGSDDEVQLLQSNDGGTTWITLTTWNAANEPDLGGTEYIEDLTGVTGTSVLFAIWASDGVVDDAEDYDFHVGKFRVRVPPTCPEPINLALDAFTGDTADISWTAGDVETAWEVVVQPVGTGEPTGSGVATTNNPYTETGLIPVTDYEVYVRADCGGDFSSWVGPITFQTACTTFVPDYNADMTVNVPDCWDESDDGEVADGPSGSGTSDWDDGNTYALGASNAINLFQGNTDREWLLSPLFDLSADGYQLEINVAVTNWNDGFADDTMGSDDEVQLLQSNDGGATWTTLTTWNAANEPALGGTEYIEDLTGVTGTSVQFAIWASDGTVDDAEDYDFHVGKFRIRVPPTCPEPINLALDTFTDISADISWTSGGAETSWEIVVQPAGTGIPTGPGVVTTNNPYAATGLTATTDYEIWVRGDCGVDGLSSWVGPLTFTTFNTPPPPPVGVTCTSGSSSFIFTGEFDGVDGWTGDLNGGDGTWEIPNDSGSFGTGPDAAFSGGNFMNYEASGGAITASAVSPAIDLTTAVDGAELSFYMHAFGADMGTLNVGISTSQAGPFTNEFTWAGDLQTSGTDPWVPIGINLDAYLGQVIYIEFSHTGTGDFEGDMSIDLVRVETCGTFCIAPSTILISNATQTTADIDWTANSGEMAWEYVVVPLGTGEPTGSGTAVTSTSVTATGLTGTTEYEVWVRADCGGGTFSLWSGPIPFFTAPSNNDPCNATMAVVNADESCDLTTFGTILQATPSGVPSGTCTGDPDDDVWFEFVALGEQQIISITNINGGTFNIDHAVYEGTDCNNLTQLSCTDEDLALTPGLTIGNTYYVRVFSGGSDNETSTFDLCINTLGPPTFCLEALPICALDIQYPSITGDDVAPEYLDYGCLGSAPDPTWNAIFFDAAGDYTFTLAQTGLDGLGNDIDFIVWGPFNSSQDFCYELLPETIADCSFSAVSIETVTLTGVQAGDIYLILITNFSEEEGFYTFTQETGPVDGTSCEIVCGAQVLYQDIPVVEDITNIGFGEPIELCGVDSIDLEASSPYADTYQWYDGDSIPIAGATDPVLTVTESGGYFVEVSGDVCDGFAYSIQVLVTLGEEAMANPVADIITCDDASADEVEVFELDDQTGTILGGQDPTLFNVTYHFSPSDAGQGLNPLALSYPNTSNPQTIYVRVEDANAPGCFALTSFQLVISGPTPTVSSGVVYSECDDDMDGVTLFDLATQDGNLLGTQSATDFTVSYYETQMDAEDAIDAIDTSVLYSSDSTTIFVRIDNNLATDCYSTGTLELIVNPLPDTSFTTNFDYEVCPGGNTPIQITATANNYSVSDVTISWFFDSGLIAGENGLTLSVVDAGLYEIRVVNNLTGCEWTTDQTVIELANCVIPQGISPNDDGINEDFDLSSFDVSKLEIFNRNGVLVYSKNNYTNEWHGQSDNGNELPVGTYFYTMEYENGKQRAAWVYIQREK